MLNNILVTGGAGFIGSHLIPELVKKYSKAKIISLDNYFTGTTDNHFKHKNVKYVKGDTRNILNIWKENKYALPDAIFHLGEYSRIVQSFEDFDTVWDFNMDGTKEIIRFAGNSNAKLVYAGSSSKFGNNGKDENLSPYAWMKAKNIELIKNYSEWFGLDYVITYFYNVYGPGQIKTGKYSTVIGIFESQFEKGEPLTVVAPGTQTRDFTHIDDIVSGIIVCFEKGEGDGYELGYGKERKLIDVARMFSDNITMLPSKVGERKSGKANYKKAKALGWKAKIDLKEYIKGIVSE